TRFDGEWIHLAAIHADAAGTDRLRAMYPARPSGTLASFRSIRDRAVVHIPDVLEDEEFQGQQAATAAGFRAVLSVPMLRDGQPEREYVYRCDAQVLRVVVAHNSDPEFKALIERNPPTPGRASGAGRAAIERRTIHIHDVQSDPEYTYAAAQINPIRTLLAIP